MKTKYVYELIKGDVIDLGNGVVGRITNIYDNTSKPDYKIILFSDGFITEYLKEDKVEILN